MKGHLFRRLLAAVLCASMFLTACGTGKSGNKSSTDMSGSKEVTMGEAADYLLAAASGYNKNLPKREELMDNLYGLQEKDKASKIQVLIMLSQAFGELPQPKGNNARLADKEVSLEGVEEWAREPLEKLKAAGVLAASDLKAKEAAGEQETAGTSEQEKEQTKEESSETVRDQAVTEEPGKDSGTKESSDNRETVTVRQLENLVRRIYALYGTELKDDFYAQVNKNDLDTKEIPAGETDAGGTYDQTIKVQKQINSIIKEIVEGSGYEPGSREDKIKKFYESAVDFQKRNALGAEPIKKYMDAIDSAASLEELNKAQELALKEIGCGGLLQIAYMNDSRDNQKTAATLSPPVEPMQFGEDDEHLIKLLVLTGESEEQAKEHVKAYREMEKEISDTDPGKESVRFVTVEELEKILPGVDVGALIKANGDDMPKELCLMSPAIFEKCGEILQKTAYLDAVKTSLKLGIITTTYTYLSKDFLDAFDEYNQKSMGQAAGNSTPEEIAYAMVQNILGDYIDQYYAEKYFSPEAKKDVEKMVHRFIEVYKERISKLEWMGKATKEAAIEKLDKMKFFIGYPDQWSNRMEELEVTDNYFRNMVEAAEIMAQANRKEAEAKNKGEQENYMKIPVATVNAYYDQYSNTMCFPAGILQAPMYDVNASLEENLGGIGTTIAHEISHAFDNNGAKFDAKGQQKDWWTKKDYKAFEKLCGKTVDFYDRWESAPGVVINGKQTLGENIADIGGVACALEVLKKEKNPDYDKFFKSYATGWLKCTTRERAESLAEVDEHSPSNLRVNRVLVNFQEFYDTYDIKEGDGMYVAPKDRIEIW